MTTNFALKWKTLFQIYRNTYRQIMNITRIVLKQLVRMLYQLKLYCV